MTQELVVHQNLDDIRTVTESFEVRAKYKSLKPKSEGWLPDTVVDKRVNQSIFESLVHYCKIALGR